MNKYLKLILICLLIIFCFVSLVYANDDLIEEKVEYLFKGFKSSNSKVTKNDILEEIFKIDNATTRKKLLLRLENVEQEKREVEVKLCEELVKDIENNNMSYREVFGSIIAFLTSLIMLFIFLYKYKNRKIILKKTEC